MLLHVTPTLSQRLIDFVSCSSVTSLGFYLASLADRPKNLPLYQTVQLDIDKIVKFIRFELPLNIPCKKPQIKTVELLVQPDQKVEDKADSGASPKPTSEPTQISVSSHYVKSSPNSSPKPSSSIPASSSTPDQAPSTQLKCPHCDVKRSDPETLKLHAHIEHFICMKCSVQFTDDEKLQVRAEHLYLLPLFLRQSIKFTVVPSENLNLFLIWKILKSNLSF